MESGPKYATEPIVKVEAMNSELLSHRSPESKLNLDLSVGKMRCVVHPKRSSVMNTAVIAIRKLLDRSGGAPFVAMMQPAQHRYRGDPPRRRRLNRSRGRHVLLQCQVNAASMIILDERLEVLVQASLIEHHHMIQTLTTNRADESLNVSTLPGSAAPTAPV